MSQTPFTRRVTLLKWAAPILFLAGGAVAQASAPRITGLAQVIDGDTLKIMSLPPVRVRLAAVDAFEKSQTCLGAQRTPTPCGVLAQAALQRFVGQGRVTCERQSIDQYGRWVAECWLSDGQSLNRHMVRQGYAVAYLSFSKKYLQHERWAKANCAGAWQGVFVLPSVERRAAVKGQSPQQSTAKKFQGEACKTG